MNLKEIERAVAKVQEQLFRRANDMSIGLFKSRFRGSGVQFKEHQIYTPGDDVRFIDWKLSAKSVGKTFVKTFEEERNVEVISIVDISPTMFMGHNTKTKLEVSLEVIFLIYLITQKTKDYQRVVLFYDKVIQLPLLSGRKGIASVISLLKKHGLINDNGNVKGYGEFTPESKIKKMKFLKSIVAKKKEILYFTDFFDENEDPEFKKILNHRNFHCFHLRTPLDYAKKQPYSFQSNEGRFVFKLNSKPGDHREIERKNVTTLDLDREYFDDFISAMRTGL